MAHASAAFWRDAVRAMALDEPPADVPALPIALRRRRSFTGGGRGVGAGVGVDVGIGIGNGNGNGNGNGLGIGNGNGNGNGTDSDLAAGAGFGSANAAAGTRDPRSTVELVRDDEGILRWLYTPPAWTGRGPRRTYRSVHVPADRVVARFRFNDLGSNRVTEGLVGVDRRLSGDPGLMRWQPAGDEAAGGHLLPEPAPEIREGRVLLLVHGTFSRASMFFDELRTTAEGRTLLADWAARYGAILAFNHATLSVGAWSNAIDLARALAGVKAPIDVVGHSRGGLVLSWLMRLEALPIERAVFVASPLVGTSLAAPDRLRSALDLMANYADLATAAALSADEPPASGPLQRVAAGAAGLARVLGSTLRLGSGLPALDAGVALVPGLASQSHVRNNLELRQLFADRWRCTPEMCAIGAAFQPAESQQPLWKVWRRFTHLRDQAMHAAADRVFDAPNDLVVDVDSMFRLGEGASMAFRDLGPSATLHHTRYFRDRRVLDEIRRRLD